MPTPENKAVIRKFVEEVINQGQIERANDLVVENFIELDPLPGQQQGREGLKAIIGYLRSAFPDMHWTIHEMIAEGESVCTRFNWTATHRGEFLGIPATGRSVNVKGVVIDLLADGKMSQSRILMDTMGLMQQLGVIPAPPAA
jgi:steroid delta-isomerase-like uncharacterized protein